MARRSSALPLGLLFAGLVVYASLYPFEGWRVQGVAPLAFLAAPLPQYWTGFDVLSNLVGYAPLGFLLTVALLRAGMAMRAALWATLACAALSLSVETLQTFLPARVPSNIDLALNTAGAAIGATLANVLQRLGWLDVWSRWRADWLAPHAHGGLVLLALWPFALLYPAQVPFGLGQVGERALAGLQDMVEGTPFALWLPSQSLATSPLSPFSEAWCIALGLLAPLMLGYSDLRTLRGRLLFLPALLLLALGVAGLSAALTYGPAHAWAWVHPPVLAGFALAGGIALLTLWLPRRLCNVLMLLVLAVLLTVLNQSADTPYFAQSLEAWEQGRFIRFHGLSQWLGWLWPFAALLYGLRAVAVPPRA